ncbi:MAG: zinc-ribbon domain-containing protein, partial [Patescibacteria group bacterium]
MDINCPYCGTQYELNDSLLPEDNIKVRCRVCSNVFMLNKNIGAFKDEPNGEVKSEISAHAGSDDFMQSIMSEINSAVAEDTGKPGKSGKNKNDSGSDEVSAQSSSTRKGRTTPFQIAMLIVLIIVFLIAAASALVHYNIINIPFLPSA